MVHMYKQFTNKAVKVSVHFVQDHLCMKWSLYDSCVCVRNGLLCTKWSLYEMNVILCQQWTSGHCVYLIIRYCTQVSFFAKRFLIMCVLLERKILISLIGKVFSLFCGSRL